MTVDDYLIAAWKRGAPNADTSSGFPTGFWPDVARAAVELALTGEVSFRQTQCGQGDWPDPNARRVKGIDVSKLEFKL